MFNDTKKDMRDEIRSSEMRIRNEVHQLIGDMHDNGILPLIGEVQREIVSIKRFVNIA